MATHHVWSTQVGEVERATTRWAIQWRGSRLDRDRQLRPARRGGRGADDQALAARPVHPLEHQLVPASQRVGPHRRVHEVHRLDVLQDRVFAEVVPDHVGDVGVDELVVGHAVAHGVGDGDPSGPGRVDDAGAADQGLGAELRGVEEVVVDPAIDDMDRDFALGGAQEHLGAVADQVASLDQVHAHEAGQQRMLVEGRVVDARGEHHHGRILDARRRGPAQGVNEVGRVVGHHLNGLPPEELGEDPRHGGPVGQHVADAGRAADIVLQHAELALLVPDDVDAGHVDPHPVRRGRRRDAARTKPGRAGDHLMRDQRRH